MGFSKDRSQKPGDKRPLENTPSPIALPHKALALLGIQEASCFRLPPSPIPWSDLDDQDDVYVEDNVEFGLGLGLGGLAPPFSSLRGTSGPDQIYFRPQSLCSSFTARSEKSMSCATCATTLTSVMATPALSLRSLDDYGTTDSHSTLKDVCMLDLEDSDDEEIVYNAPEQRSYVPRNCAPELPMEITMQICGYFVSNTHQEDLSPRERLGQCPNCNVHSLWALSLVSRTWSMAANRMLYDTVSLDFGHCGNPETYSARGSAAEFIPYTACQHVDGSPVHTKFDVDSKLQLLYRTIWDSQGDFGERIRGIKLPRRLFSITRYPLLAILQKCPNLEFLDHAVASGSAEELFPLLSKMKYMKQWTWKREETIVRSRRGLDSRKSSEGPPAGITLQVFPLWTQLRHLELNNLRKSDIPDEFDFCAAFPSLESMRLRKLCIVDGGHEAMFINRLPALRKLEIDSCLFISTDRIISYIETKGSKLTHLTLHDSVIPVYMLYRLLAYTPLIVELTVSNCRQTAPFTENLWDSPVGFVPSLPSLSSLSCVNLDMRPLRESFWFLLNLVEHRLWMPKLHTMQVGFGAAGKAPELGRGIKSMNGEEMRMEVRLRTKCLFNDVQLSIMEPSERRCL